MTTKQLQKLNIKVKRFDELSEDEQLNWINLDHLGGNSADWCISMDDYEKIKHLCDMSYDGDLRINLTDRKMMVKLSEVLV